MSRGPAGKIRFFVGQPVNAPFVTPPISLRAMLVVSILSVTGTLFYAVVRRLNMTTSTDTVFEIAISLIYFVLPVLIAHSIAVNRSWSRPLIVVYTIAVAWQALGWLSYAPEDLRLSGLAMLAALLMLVFIWLFASLKMRVYYALVSGRDLPRYLDRPADEILAPGPAERWFRRLASAVAPYIEMAIVVVVIAAILLALVTMNIPLK